jgi:signal transduction histidine kinase/CheY-like chemotaxis protein
MKETEPFSSLLMEAINLSEEYVFAAAEDGTLLFANQVFCKLHDLNAETDINTKRIPDFSPFIDEERWKKFVNKLKKEGTRRDLIIYSPLPNHPEIKLCIGDIYYMKRLNGEGFIWGIGKDVTHLTEEQQNLSKENEQLQLEKEKAELSDKNKSVFLANMSHEIRTPLNAIVGFSRIIAESKNAQERKSYYKMVARNSERLLQLINEILDLSKMEAGKIEFVIAPVNLKQLCKETYESIQFRCPEGVTFTLETPDEDIRISTDRNRIIQVLNNLIGNAFKHTNQGSVRFGYRREAGMITFHVTDTGAGIPEEKVAEVFDRFAKASEKVEGTGLGLSICKLIVERLGGEISVTSKWGEGSTFTFTLPDRLEEGEQMTTQPEGILTTQPENGSEETATNNGDDTPKHEGEKRYTLLVAEDENYNYILVKAILSRDYQLVHAKDGMEAIQLFEESNPDLILMDMRMPNLGGLDATRAIREMSQEVPIIAFTAFAFEHDKEAAFEAGCNDFLPKPFTQEQLKDVIHKWLKKQK